MAWNNLSKSQNITHIGELSYTEDNIVIYTIYVSNIPPKVEEDQLRTYFQKFGPVAQVNVIHRNGNHQNKLKSYKFGFVNFTDPVSASKALRQRHHILSHRQLNVRSADSWKQPHQKRINLNSNKDENDDNSLPNDDNISILNLNDDCLFMIFKYLPFNEQIHISTLCTRFQNIFELLYKTKKSLKIDLAQPLTLMDFREGLQQMGQHIEKITFSSGLSMKNFTRFIDFVSQYCPNLQNLHLDSLHFKFTDIFRKISFNLKTIKHLELKNCSINDDMIRQLSNITTIEDLDLTQNYEVTGRYLDKFENLKRLILNACVNIQSTYFIHMCRKVIKLKELNIRRCDRLNSSAFDSMIQNLNELEILTICTCYQTLEFERITELKNLKCLTVNNSNVKTDILLQKLAKDKADQLEILKVTNFNHNMDKIKSLLELKKLKQIDLPFSSNLTGEFLLLLTELKQLKILTIPGCTNLTKSDLIRFIQISHNIEFIDISKFSQLDESFIWELIEILKKLNRIAPLTLKIGSDYIKETIKENPKYIAGNQLIKLDFNTTDYVMEMYDESLHYMSDEEEDDDDIFDDLFDLDEDDDENVDYDSDFQNFLDDYDIENMDPLFLGSDDYSPFYIL